jgi:hypothetical protein
MRIAGFFLGLLFLSAGSGHGAAAQTAAPPSAAASAANSATNPTQANLQEPSSSKPERDDSGSGGEHKLSPSAPDIPISPDRPIIPTALIPFISPDGSFQRSGFPTGGPTLSLLLATSATDLQKER